MEDQLGEWFPRSIKPHHIGVYEVRKRQNGKVVRWFSWWNGATWGLTANTPEAAAEHQDTESNEAKRAGGFQWRGITKQGEGE